MSYMLLLTGIRLHRLYSTVLGCVGLYRAVKRCVGHCSVEYACIDLYMAV